MELTKELREIVTLDLMWTVALGLAAYYLIEWLKYRVVVYREYRLFISNPYVSLGSHVSVNGFDGQIVKITSGTIVVVGANKDVKVIPTTRWRFADWTFLATCPRKGEDHADA